MPDHQHPVIIAHRGESHDLPENTLSAVNLAWNRGARAVEVDVRASADGQLMVIHDSQTWRIGGPDTPVSRQTAKQLRALDAGSWKHPRWAGERIPYLREVLATIPPAGRLLIEIKEGREVVPPLSRLLNETGTPAERLIVMCFDPPTVAACTRALPRVEACQLLLARDWSAPGALTALIAAAANRGCQAVNLERHQNLDARVIDTIHAAGLKVYVWTINHLSQARRLRDAGIDGIATDRCEWLTKRLDAAPHRRDCGP